MIGAASLEWWQFLGGTLLPLLTALVTARVATPAVKSLCLAALAVLIEVVSEVTQAVADTGQFSWTGSWSDVVMTFVIAVAMHYGLWKPTTVTGSNGIIQASAPGGLGWKGGSYGRQA